MAQKLAWPWITYSHACRENASVVRVVSYVATTDGYETVTKDKKTPWDTIAKITFIANIPGNIDRPILWSHWSTSSRHCPKQLVNLTAWNTQSTCKPFALQNKKFKIDTWQASLHTTPNSAHLSLIEMTSLFGFLVGLLLSLQGLFVLEIQLGLLEGTFLGLYPAEKEPILDTPTSNSLDSRTLQERHIFLLSMSSFWSTFLWVIGFSQGFAEDIPFSHWLCLILPIFWLPL